MGSWEGNLVLVISVISALISSLITLVPARRLAKRMNARHQDAFELVKKEYAGRKVVYYVKELVRVRFYYAFLILVVAMGDFFILLSYFVFINEEPSRAFQNAMFLILFGLIWSLLFPIVANRYELTKESHILAVSKEGFDKWIFDKKGDVISTSAKWSDVEQVSIRDINYGRHSGIIPIPLRYDYKIIIEVLGQNIEVGGHWPNAIRLLNDLLRFEPNPERWSDWKKIRKEVDRWKKEDGMLVTNTDR